MINSIPALAIDLAIRIWFMLSSVWDAARSSGHARAAKRVKPDLDAAYAGTSRTGYDGVHQLELWPKACAAI